MKRSKSPFALDDGSRRQRWYVDVLVVEARRLVGGGSLSVSCSLESSPEVRFLSSPTPGPAHVWNSDASFVSAAASLSLERLHVSLVSKHGKLIWGKCAIDLEPLSKSSVPQKLWFALRDVHDAVCVVQDAPLRSPDDPLPFGFLSAGLICVQIQVSQTPTDMFLSKYGAPLRLLPCRVQPGDLLFFSSKKLATTGTKLASRSRWDHVALVIAYKDYKKTYLLESNSLGVQVNEAEAALKNYWEHSHAFGVRRLLRPADPSFASSLSDFAEKNVGKAYNYNFTQVFGRRKTLTRKDVQSVAKMVASSGSNPSTPSSVHLPPSGSGGGSAAMSMAAPAVVASGGVGLVTSGASSLSSGASASVNSSRSASPTLFGSDGVALGTAGVGSGGGSSSAASSPQPSSNISRSASGNLVQSVAEDGDEKLFCSQLVAAAYISVGVLEASSTPANFLPATFAKSNVLTDSGTQLLPLREFPCASPKSWDVIWAREETYLKKLFRDSLTQGVPKGEKGDVRHKLLKQIRKHLLVVALYSHNPDDKTELSFEEGDTIMILEKDPSGWWTGQHQETGRIGFFPGNFTALIGERKRSRRERGSAGSKSPTGAGASDGDVLASTSPLSSPSRKTGGSLAHQGQIRCSSCGESFDEKNPMVAFGTRNLHEECLALLVANNIRCYLCSARVAAQSQPCPRCNRPVCEECIRGCENLCRVCDWLLVAPNSAALATLIALRSHDAGCVQELSFQKGEEIELLERTDFGWFVGRTSVGSVGLFPGSATASVVKKFSLRRLGSSGTRRKYPARGTVHGGSPASTKSSPSKPPLRLSSEKVDEVLPAAGTPAPLELPETVPSKTVSPVIPKLPVGPLAPVSPSADTGGLVSALHSTRTPRTPVPQLPPLGDDRLLRSSAYTSIMADDQAQMTARQVLASEELSDSDEDSVESLSWDDGEDDDDDDDHDHDMDNGEHHLNSSVASLVVDRDPQTLAPVDLVIATNVEEQVPAETGDEDDQEDLEESSSSQSLW